VVDDEIVLSGFSQFTTGYNILENQFATLNSELDARARGVGQIAYEIATRLAVRGLHVRRGAGAAVRRAAIRNRP
jgi:hypothetical protein